MRFESDAQPVRRRRLLPLALLASGLLWGLEGLIVGEDRGLVVLIAIAAAYYVWRFSGRFAPDRDQGEPA